MDSTIRIKHKWLLLPITCFYLLFWSGNSAPPLSKDEDDPVELREKKWNTLREKKDRFFKKETQSPEPCPTEPKLIYALLPTNKGKEKKHIKYGRFIFN